MGDSVNHPDHYGGADNLYEAIKVIEAWDLGFCLGNTVKYISRAGLKINMSEIISKGGTKAWREAKIEDLKKARWYLDREIQILEAMDNG